MLIPAGSSSTGTSKKPRASLLVVVPAAVVLVSVVLVTVLLIATAPVLRTAPASATTATARSLLTGLTVGPETGNSTYVRSYFRHWVDADGDCQNTRAEVLIAESKTAPTYATSRRCALSSGRWASYYDGVTWTRPADVDIDHLVPLKEAWGSGARLWPAGNRTRFANDLGFPASLVAVTDNVNQGKSDQDPADWLPPRTAVRCTYATQWVQVKYRWRLSIDPAERIRLSSILSGACGSRAATVPARAI